MWVVLKSLKINMAYENFLKGGASADQGLGAVFPAQYRRWPRSGNCQWHRLLTLPNLFCLQSQERGRKKTTHLSALEPHCFGFNPGSITYLVFDLSICLSLPVYKMGRKISPLS